MCDSDFKSGVSNTSLLFPWSGPPGSKRDSILSVLVREKLHSISPPLFLSRVLSSFHPTLYFLLEASVKRADRLPRPVSPAVSVGAKELLTSLSKFLPGLCSGLVKTLQLTTEWALELIAAQIFWSSLLWEHGSFSCTLKCLYLCQLEDFGDLNVQIHSAAHLMAHLLLPSLCSLTSLNASQARILSAGCWGYKRMYFWN